MESRAGSCRRTGEDARRSIHLTNGNLILHTASVAPSADLDGLRPAFGRILWSFRVK
jgi:hypothetical protein